MWRAPVITVPANVEPLTRVQLKAHLGIDAGVTDFDTLVDGYAASARSHVEGVTATRLVSQTVTVRTDSWADLARLPVAPVQSVTSIAYIDQAGQDQTLGGTVYDPRLEGLEPMIALKFGQAWPPILPGSLITLTLVVGYGAAGAQPPAVLHALRLLVGDYFAHRETAVTGVTTASVPVASSVDDLLSNHKLQLI